MPQTTNLTMNPTSCVVLSCASTLRPAVQSCNRKVRVLSGREQGNLGVVGICRVVGRIGHHPQHSGPEACVMMVVGEVVQHAATEEPDVQDTSIFHSHSLPTSTVESG
jgi:hypothetical protein